MNQAQSWRIVPQSELHWRRWEDGVVIYDHGSGDTHLVSYTGSEILLFLTKHPANIEKLTRHMALKLDKEIDQTFDAYIIGALADLNKLGLIEPVTL